MEEKVKQSKEIVPKNGGKKSAPVQIIKGEKECSGFSVETPAGLLNVLGADTLEVVKLTNFLLHFKQVREILKFDEDD